MSNQHRLSSVAVSMLAIGGTIGTGLFFSVSVLLTKGPLITLLSMSYVAVIVVSVLQTAGELAANFPETGLICRFQFMFLGPLAGLANSIVYWVSWGLTFALEQSLVVSILRFWAPEFGVAHESLIILTVWASLTIFNLLPVEIYGQIEYWMSLVKVVAILAWIVVVLATLIWQHRVFSIWTSNWPASFLGSPSSVLRFVVDLMSSLVFLSFLFQSVESVAISTREIENPRVLIPKVINILFFRILLFYLVSVLLLSLSILYQDERLADPTLSNLLSSPFLIALQNLGLGNERWLLFLFNFVILSAILLAANSNIYFGSRYLQTLVETEGPQGKWAIFARVNNNSVPVNAILATAAFGAVSFLLKFHSIAVVFNFLLTCCALAGMLMWLLLSLSYVRYSIALENNGLLWLRWRRYMAIWATASMVVILGCCGLEVFYSFTWMSFICSYMTVILFLGLYIAFGGGYIPIESVDLKGLRRCQPEYGATT